MRDPAGIAAAIQAAESICVCGHVNPDGDAVGSALAMRLILTGMGKKVRVFFQDKIPDYLSFLTGVDDVRKPETCTERFDLFLAVDSSEAVRMGACAKLMENCARTAQIDHHGTNPGYAEVNSVDADASATGTMIREQMTALGAPMTREIAECLYAAISTDTGNFSFDCTDAETFRVMGDLVEAGLPLAELNMRLFREKSMPQLKLLGRAIEKMRYAEDGKISVMTLTQQDFRDCSALPEHADMVVNYGLETIGTKMAILARENDDGKIKFSLRARAPLTVDDVAARLGGGGHARAAGINMDGTLESTVQKVLEAMTEKLRSEAEGQE